MLTADLLRSRKRKKKVEALFVDPDDAELLALANEMLEIFREGVGEERGVLDQERQDRWAHRTDHLLTRGLMKLIEDRATFEVECAHDPVELRRMIFTRAAKANVRDLVTRTAVIEEVRQHLQLSAEEVERSLHADLQERHVLKEFEDLAAAELLHRYNLALAQAVLYQAVELTFRVYEPDGNAMRYLLQVMKFHGLMFRITQRPDGYECVVDGPASLFRSSRKYGLKMALFLPALVLQQRWDLKATLQWGKKRIEAEFELSDEAGLVSHYKPRGQWVSREERAFEKKFKAYEGPWSLTRQARWIALAEGEYLISDYVLKNEDGREIPLEIIWFWRKDYLMRRLELLHRSKVNMVMVVSEKLKTDRAALEDALDGRVVFFKTAILIDKVIEAAER